MTQLLLNYTERLMPVSDRYAKTDGHKQGLLPLKLD